MLVSLPDAIRSLNEPALKAWEAVKADAGRLRGLRELLGYVENGSDTTVKLYQDDATRSFFVEVGKRRYCESTFTGALGAAINLERTRQAQE